MTTGSLLACPEVPHQVKSRAVLHCSRKTHQDQACSTACCSPTQTTPMHCSSGGSLSCPGTSLVKRTNNLANEHLEELASDSSARWQQDLTLPAAEEKSSTTPRLLPFAACPEDHMPPRPGDSNTPNSEGGKRKPPCQHCLFPTSPRCDRGQRLRCRERREWGDALNWAERCFAACQFLQLFRQVKPFIVPIREQKS